MSVVFGATAQTSHITFDDALMLGRTLWRRSDSCKSEGAKLICIFAEKGLILLKINK